MKELDELITYIENDLIGKHKDIKIIDEAIKKYAELYHKKQLELQNVSHCTCTPDETTGTTSVNCCNICGKPTEDFWRCR